MKVNKYKAKALNTDKWVYGSYFQMPKINRGGVVACTDEEWNRREKENIGHYIIRVKQGDWNLPNEASMVEIDPKTLTYADDSWETE